MDRISTNDARFLGADQEAERRNEQAYRQLTFAAKKVIDFLSRTTPDISCFFKTTPTLEDFTQTDSKRGAILHLEY
jgi:hypothetical protein